MRAFIHSVGGTPFNEECESAQRGFERLGVETVLFSNNEILDKATRNDVVVGGLLVCEHALALQGVSMPTIDYPSDLTKYLGRRITIKQVSKIKPQDLPVFVKPIQEKDLPGLVIENEKDLEPYLAKGEDYQLYVSKPVRFVSEWRVFVRNGQVLGARHYLGDCAVEPDWIVALQAVARFGSHRLNGYALDIGVTEGGQTLLVEVNDGFALGSYGLDDVSYALLLSARWSQLMGVPDALHDVSAPAAVGPIVKAMRSQEWNDYLCGVPGQSIPAQEPDLPRWLWGVVANVREYPAGMPKDQAETRRKGTKHLAPGTLVWVMEPSWGWFDRMTVVGKEKGTHRYVRKVMGAEYLEHFRVKRTYSPTIISWMRGARSELINHGDCGSSGSRGEHLEGAWWDRSWAEEFVEYQIEHQKENANND